MIESIIVVLENRTHWIIGVFVVGVLLFGICQRIYERPKYGAESGQERVKIQPLHYYGAMPTSGSFQKPDFRYDPHEELGDDDIDGTTL